MIFCSIKFCQFLDQLRNRQLLNDSAPCSYYLFINMQLSAFLQRTVWIRSRVPANPCTLSPLLFLHSSFVPQAPLCSDSSCCGRRFLHLLGAVPCSASLRHLWLASTDAGGDAADIRDYDIRLGHTVLRVDNHKPHTVPHHVAQV